MLLCRSLGQHLREPRVSAAPIGLPPSQDILLGVLPLSVDDVLTSDRVVVLQRIINPKTVSVDSQ